MRPDNLTGGVPRSAGTPHKLGVDPRAPIFLLSEFDAARELRAHALWDGKALTKSYQQTRAQLEKWLTRAPKLEPDVAARESFLMGNSAIRQVVFDPLLPDPLVSVSERRAFVDTVLRYDRAGQAIWRRFLSPLIADGALPPSLTH